MAFPSSSLRLALTALFLINFCKVDCGGGDGPDKMWGFYVYFSDQTRVHRKLKSSPMKEGKNSETKNI